MSPAIITLLFLAFAIVMFVTEKIPLGLTAMIVCIGMPILIIGILFYAAIGFRLLPNEDAKDDGSS